MTSIQLQPADTPPDGSGGSGCPATSATSPAIALTHADAEDLAAVLKALADPTRLRLLWLIAAGDDGEACVCELTEPVGLSQPTVSHHLRQLVEADLISRRQRGRWAYYRVVPGALQAVAGRLDLRR